MTSTCSLIYESDFLKVLLSIMSLLTDPNPDSPLSAERRHKMKEDIYVDIHDLQVRVKLMEERNKK